MDLQQIIDQKLLTIGNYYITIGGIIIGLLILAFTRLGEWVANGVLLKKYFKRKEVDQGRSFAISQIVKYTIYLIGTIFLINHVVGSVSFLALGSAGLFVGVGLGLQQTFTDFISGIILLVDRSSEVGDIIVIDGQIGQVKKIGLRSSEIYTRDRVSVIVPNSKLISNNFTNWSHNDEPARFYVEVGVAYSSDIKKVEEVLLACVKTNEKVLDNPEASVQLVNFGPSSLDFRLYYFSNEFFFAERVKSDLRKELFRMFEKENIQIPFPQQDIWIKDANFGKE